MHLVAIVSQKGGGGKTTVATNLAATSAAQGVPTLLLDLDPQQSAFRWGRWRKEAGHACASLGVEAADCASIADKLKAAKAQGVKLCVIDTPPAKAPEADAAAGSAHLVLVVVQPSMFDLMTLAETHTLGGVASRSAFVVLNRAPVSGSTLADAREQVTKAGFEVAPVALSERVTFRAAPVEGQAAFEIEPSGKAAAEVSALYAWVLSELKKTKGAPQPSAQSTWGTVR